MLSRREALDPGLRCQCKSGPSYARTAVRRFGSCETGGVSASNVELARQGFEAVARGDLEALAVILDPEVQGHGNEGSGADSCHDRGEALEFIRQTLRRGGVGQLVDVIAASDNDVVVVMRRDGPPGSDESALRANRATFREGKVVRMVAFDAPGFALAAAPG